MFKLCAYCIYLACFLACSNPVPLKDCVWVDDQYQSIFLPQVVTTFIRCKHSLAKSLAIAKVHHSSWPNLSLELVFHKDVKVLKWIYIYIYAAGSVLGHDGDSSESQEITWCHPFSVCCCARGIPLRSSTYSRDWASAPPTVEAFFYHILSQKWFSHSQKVLEDLMCVKQ